MKRVVLCNFALFMSTEEWVYVAVTHEELSVPVTGTV
jgi:hypothetical protein